MRHWLLSLPCLIATIHAEEIATQDSQPSALDELPCLPLAGLITDELPLEILPYAGPAVTWSNDVNVECDFIYWYVNQEGLGYAYTQASNELQTPIHKGRLFHPDRGMHPGYKIGLGMVLNRDFWDFNAQYTWLHANDDKKREVAQTQEDSKMVPQWLSTTTLSPTSRLVYGSSSWGLHFNAIDLELGKNFFVSRYLKMRPFIGLKGTWQTQDYNVVYENEVASVPNRYKMSVDQDYSGIGPRMGFENHFHFCPKLSLYGQFALTSLWGFFETLTHTWVTENFEDPAAIEALQYRAMNSHHDLQAVSEWAIGLQFDHWFADDEFHLALRASYECQTYWGQNQFFNPYDANAHGDLSMQGLTLEFRIDF